MKRISQIFRRLFKTPLPLIFLVVNWIVCAVVFDWQELSFYLSKINEIGCKPKGISFGLHDFTGGHSNDLFGFSNPLLIGALTIILMFLSMLLAIVYLGLTGPSLILTECAMGILKNLFSHWCPETFEILTVPLFALFNSIYWVFLAIFFEYIHSSYTENKPPRKNPVSIYSK